ncbi:hypothetical protein [Fluviicola sp.]|uniref:hypothetical protein n=1 Tax=Fluviicola sp. TaxID=1917219 RepID=UPI0031DBBD09
MKTFILALAVLVGGTAMAQQQGQGKREHKTAEERATGVTEKMTTQLGLDDSQKAKIQEVNLGIAKKNDAIRENTSLTREQKMAQMKQNHDARDAQYKTILTTDQYAKYEAWEKEKKEKMEAKRAERQGQGQRGGKAASGTKTKTAPSTGEPEEEL